MGTMMEDATLRPRREISSTLLGLCEQQLDWVGSVTDAKQSSQPSISAGRVGAEAPRIASVGEYSAGEGTANSATTSEHDGTPLFPSGRADG